MGIWAGPSNNYEILGPIQAHNPKSISIGSAIFAQMTAVSLYFTMGCPSPSKLTLPKGDLYTSNAWFPGPTLVLNPNGVSIGSGVFAGFITVTDRQTTLLGR